MKKQPRKAKKAVIVLAVAALLVIAAGCGGGGSSSIAPTQAPQAQDLMFGDDLSREVPYDVDVVPPDGVAAGRAAGLTAQTTVEKILSLRDYFAGLPDDAFNMPTEEEIALGALRRERLAWIIGKIESNAARENYRQARMLIERKLVPRIDGCAGGNVDDDYIVECGTQTIVYNKTAEMLSLLSTLTNTKKGGGGAGRAANAVDLAAFKNQLLTMVNDIKNMISSALDNAFTGVVADPRGMLIGILNIAANYALDGDFEAMKSTIQNSFLPLVDGGAGGDPADDLLQAWVYGTAQYTSGISLANEIIQTTTLTRITITVAPDLLVIGTAANAAATCAYSDQYSEDCTASVAWASSNPAVGAVGPGGVFTAASGGITTVTAAWQGVTSNAVNVEVLGTNTLYDDFNGAALNLLKWSDVYNSAAASLALAGGKLAMSGPAYKYAEIIPTEAFYVDYGEKVVLQADFDLGGSGGSFYVQGMGMMESNRTGLAVGIMNGTNYTQPQLYYSSPTSYGRIATGNTARIRVVYQAGTAVIYLNDMSAPAGSFGAALDGRQVVFFLYASASGTDSSYSVLYDNFWTNQTEPGDTRITIENLTRPFAADGSGGLAAGESFRVTVNAEPGRSNVEGGILDADTMSYVLAPALMAETAPGVYRTMGTMPSVSASNVAAVGSPDRFASVKVHTRKIRNGASAGRTGVKGTGAVEKPLPDFVLPMELRAVK